MKIDVLLKNHIKQTNRKSSAFFSFFFFPVLLVYYYNPSPSTLTHVCSVMKPHRLQPARLLCPWTVPVRILEWTVSFLDYLNFRNTEYKLTLNCFIARLLRVCNTLMSMFIDVTRGVVWSVNLKFP